MARVEDQQLQGEKRRWRTKRRSTMSFGSSCGKRVPPRFGEARPSWQISSSSQSEGVVLMYSYVGDDSILVRAISWRE
jgi:hypothetical protein